MRQALAVALGVALLAGMARHADAAKAKKKSAMNPTFIDLRGCTHFQPPMCTMINSGGKNYALVWSTPPVPPVPLNTHMRVTGQVTGTVGICFAPTVRVLSWKADKMHCPK
jgi:hypothetical protein